MRSPATSDSRRRKSRTRSASPTAPKPPEFFIDRSLGRHQIAAGLRGMGWTLSRWRSARESTAATLDDPPWLEDCGENGWVALSKDVSMIRRQPGGALTPQLAVIKARRVRVFMVMSQTLTAAGQIERFRQHDRAIQNISGVGPAPLSTVSSVTRCEKFDQSVANDSPAGVTAVTLGPQDLHAPARGAAPAKIQAAHDGFMRVDSWRACGRAKLAERVVTPNIHACPR